MKNLKQMDKKKFMRETTHLTRPPRMEGVVKEGMMQPARKRKLSTSSTSVPNKRSVYTEKQRKEYQLRSKKH